MGYRRLLALALALAIASPASLPAWPGDCGTERESVAMAQVAPRRCPVLAKSHPLPAWHGHGGMITADPSDEPDEGSDGWVPHPSPAGVNSPDARLPIAGCGLPSATGIAGVFVPSLAGISCRLRC